VTFKHLCYKTFYLNKCCSFKNSEGSCDTEDYWKFSFAITCLWFVCNSLPVN